MAARGGGMALPWLGRASIIVLIYIGHDLFAMEPVVTLPVKWNPGHFGKAQSNSAALTADWADSRGRAGHPTD